MNQQIYPRNAFDGSDDEKRAGALVAMTYLNMTIAIAYLEETKAILAMYGKYEFVAKQECERAIKVFDRYHNTLNQYLKCDRKTQENIMNVYDVLKKAEDENILGSIEEYKKNFEDHADDND